MIYRVGRFNRKFSLELEKGEKVSDFFLKRRQSMFNLGGLSANSIGSEQINEPDPFISFIEALKVLYFYCIKILINTY